MKPVAAPKTEELTHFVDEAGDGVLFGPKGRLRLNDADAPRHFMLGMVTLAREHEVASALDTLRRDLMANPLYAGIPSMHLAVNKTARCFHAKDDHAEIRAKVFELLVTLDFKFYAVIKDMRAVLHYAKSRNVKDSTYRYQPNELYDFTVRMLFKERLHKSQRHRIVFARRGASDRTRALRAQLTLTLDRYLENRGMEHSADLDIIPAYPWEKPGLQVADYCLWALQRCYERHEARFLNAIWSKVSLIRDVDDSTGKAYGAYLTRRTPPPDPEKIKVRRI
jgi:hypothetical protein